MLAVAFSTTAQQKIQKLKTSVNANKDVKINLNTSFTNIEIDTWNKDQIEVEAYLEGEKLTGDALDKALKSWNIEVNGSKSEVTITSTGNDGERGLPFGNFAFNYDRDAMRALEFELADLPELPTIPKLPGSPPFPPLPEMPPLPELPEGIGTIYFDYEAYKKDGEAYLEKWSRDYEEKYGKTYQKKMEDWAKKFENIDYDAYAKKMEAWNEKFGNAYNEKFGKDFELKMKAWGKAFGEKYGKDFTKHMEAWGENHVRDMEARTAEMHAHHNAMKSRHRDVAQHRLEIEKRIERKGNAKLKKTIKIKMPKKAKLNLNVRHGELKMASIIYDLRGDISHSALMANSIDGSKTSINVSYSPVLITNWNHGELKLNFVDKAQIENVNSLVLGSNTSNIVIAGLNGNAVIDGSFGELEISSILPSFNNLNIELENSKALLALPIADFNLQYKGNRSKLKLPNNKLDASTSYSSGNSASSKRIAINAKFSDVTLQ